MTTRISTCMKSDRTHNAPTLDDDSVKRSMLQTGSPLLRRVMTIKQREALLLVSSGVDVRRSLWKLDFHEVSERARDLSLCQP